MENIFAHVYGPFFFISVYVHGTFFSHDIKHVVSAVSVLRIKLLKISVRNIVYVFSLPFNFIAYSIWEKLL